MVNPTAITHGIAAVVLVATSIPLCAGKIPMNRWYGVRIPEAFESPQRWLDINRHGGRLLLVGGLCLGLSAALGAVIPRKHWILYNDAVLGEVVLLLVTFMILITRNARRLKAGDVSSGRRS